MTSLLHVSFGDKDETCLQNKWKAHFPDIRLVILRSEYRSVIRPISRFIDKINKKLMIRTMSSPWLYLNL